jgi:endonuclease-3
MAGKQSLTNREEKQRTRKIIRLLSRAYADAHCTLDHSNPLELLVATILSAQCTDERVNLVTPGLFRRYPDPQAFADADEGEIAQAIFQTGFHNQKARSLHGAALAVLERHGGKVPRTTEQLVRLPGVGRKTAAVVSGNAYGRREGIAVDTHVGRLTRRLGFTPETDPERVERVLMEIVPRPAWVEWSHLLIYHGRAVCISRAPRCPECVLLDLCPEGQVRVGPRARMRRAS